MKSLVTGGAGFLGSHLVDALLEAGQRVVVLDNLRRGRLEHLRDCDALSVQIDDVRDYGAVVRATEGVEVVYHLAAQSNVIGAGLDLDYSFTTNVLGTFNVLKAAAEVGARRVVFASSREVYGEPARLPVHESAALAPKNAYGASKLAAEAYCRVWQQTTGVDCVVLRFVNLYGPRDRDRVIPNWLAQARAGEHLTLYGGDQVLDFLWVGYAVKALLAATHSGGDAPVNVGSGRGTSLRDLADRIRVITQTRSAVRFLPERDVEVVRFVADVGRMQRILGVEPRNEPLDHLATMSNRATEPIFRTRCGN